VSASAAAVGTWTPTNVIEIATTFTDPEGERALTRSFWVTDPGSSIAYGDTTISSLYSHGEAVAAAIQAMSQSQLTEVAVTIRAYNSLVKPAEPSSGLSNIEDKAFLELAALNGSLTKMNVPTPAPSVFLTDGETVNPSGTGVAAYMSLAITGDTVAQIAVSAASQVFKQASPAGVLVASYIKGYYRRAKTRKRLRQGISTEIGG
jgi:hypothetical protein